MEVLVAASEDLILWALNNQILVISVSLPLFIVSTLLIAWVDSPKPKRKVISEIEAYRQKKEGMG